MPANSDNSAPRFSDRLFSEEVARANAIDGEPVVRKEPAYEFTRRTFTQPDDLYRPD